MKILLINPPRFRGIPVVREVRCAGMSPVSVYPPLKLLNIAGFLKSKGLDVDLIDANGENLEFKQLNKLIKFKKPNLVIFSSSPTTMTYDCQIARIIKKINKDIYTVLDDSHIAPVYPEKTLRKFPFIDILIRGESEKTAWLIIKNIKDLKKATGISFRVKKKVFNLEPTKPLDLNLLPLPAYELVNLNNYYSWTFGKEKRLATIITSNSCPYKCSFCIVGGATVWRGDGKQWRAKDSKIVFREINYLNKQFGIRNFYFFDETFTVDKERVKRICQDIISNNLKINWSCNSRVDTVDKETLRFMSKSGCWNICFGLESGSQKILNSVNKQTNLNQAIEIFNLCRKLKIKSSASFMVGMPQDSKETLLETLEFSKKLNPDRIQFVITTAYPGTCLYEEVKKKHFLEKDYNFQGFDAYGINNEAVLKTKYLSAKEVADFSKKMYLSFYLRPKQILRLITRFRSINDLLGLIKLVKAI